MSLVSIRRAGGGARGGRRRLYVVSLGCPKNRVDTEVMLGTLALRGYELVDTPDDADVLLVNTCSFIDEAKEESIDAILELAEHRDGGRRKLVVAGCLPQRYAGDIEDALPEVDLFVGTGEYARIDELLEGGEGSPRSAVARPYYVADHLAPRVRSTPPWTAWVRIAEGCSQRCTFCVIPRLRGKQRSRPIDDIACEVEELAAAGAVEINLVAQDLTHYGDDLRDRPDDLPALLRRLARIDGVRWIRLLYCYPHNFGDDLIELIATEPRIARYVDLPLQHVADPMLERMARRTTRAAIEALVRKLRSIDGLVLRTSFIVGHPGESEAHFEELCAFVREFEFDRVGVFRYSREEGTRSARQPDPVPTLVARDRMRRLLELQAGISRRRLAALVGTTAEVLVEGPSEDHEYVWAGRIEGQAPEIDGTTYLQGDLHGARPGDIRLGRIVQTTDHDLVAELLPPTAEP